MIVYRVINSIIILGREGGWCKNINFSMLDLFCSFACQIIRVMYGIFVIFLFYALGIFLSRLTGEFLPGSILGMILLFLALLSGVVKNDGLKPVASVITRNMALFLCR